MNFFKRYIYEGTWECPCNVPSEKKCVPPCSRRITPVERFVKDWIFDYWTYDGIHVFKILGGNKVLDYTGKRYRRDANFYIGISSMLGRRPHLTLFGKKII